MTARLRRIDGVEEGDGMRCGRYVVAVVALIVIGSAAALFVSGQILLVAVIFGVVCGMVAWSAPRLDPAARDRSLAETSIGGS